MKTTWGIFFLLAACGGGSNDSVDMAGQRAVGGGGSSPAACSSGDFSSQVVAICKTQNPPAPSPGTLGANCASDHECMSGFCLMPFGTVESYCTAACGSSGQCPKGYSCQDSGGRGPVCYRNVCVYAGADAASCVTNLNREVDTACHSGCQQQLTTWIACIGNAGRLCSQSDAHTACGIERGQLDSCCPGCDHFDL